MVCGSIFNEDVGFIGNFFVWKENRGKGYGKALWEAAQQHLGDRNIGLNAELNMMEFYESKGFSFPDFEVIRYQRVVQGPSSPMKHNTAIRISQFEADVFQDIVKYDTEINQVRRPLSLLAIFDYPKADVKVATNKDGDITGYGVMQKVGDDQDPTPRYFLGPVYADTRDIAFELLHMLFSPIEIGSEIYTDIPDTNKVAIRLAERLKFTKRGSCKRMYTKSTIPLPVQKVWGMFNIGIALC